jgi:hypothetical protein
LKESSGKEIDFLDVSVGVFKNGIFKVYRSEEVKEIFESLK